MATLSKHGVELGRIESLTHTKAYFSNGDILINRGSGWKEYGHIKAGFDPKEAWARKKAHAADVLASHPAYAAFKRVFHDCVGITHRWQVYTAIEMMPNDPDGVWSTFADDFDGWELDLDECVQLCRLFLDMEKEGKALAAAKGPAES